MSNIVWTADQKKIMKARNSNVLVSAAAGSGKTAVLVERIFQRITDEKDPVDVDRFLVVTFTNAAAAQMKERLRDRLERGLQEKPDDVHLQRQMGLIASAHISTIHSFCNFVIQNYFHRIGLDPSFRQGTNTEIELLRTETFDDILEREYEKASPDFVELADMSSLNRSDSEIGEMVRKICDYAMAEPFPMEFFDRMEQSLLVENREEWEQAAFVRGVLDDAAQRVRSIQEEQREILQVCRREEGPYYYEEAVCELGEWCCSLLACRTYDEWQKKMEGLSFLRMPSPKGKSGDKELQLQTKARMDLCREQLKELKKQFFFAGSEKHFEDMKAMRGKVLTLLRLARMLYEEFTSRKRERNVVDFNDLEQLSISILLQKDSESGQYERTEAARELAEHFVEIMIDEYQDSNRVQDVLLKSVSREGIQGKHPNIFMVGDVKQSIYRFRGACPELFAEKLDSYSLEEKSERRRMDLHQNFRSRRVVLEAANVVFEKMMRRDIGGVEYDERAALQEGRQFPETELRVAEKVDVYALLGKQNGEAEGYVIAGKIHDMVGGENPCYIARGNQYHPAQYRDIAILVLTHEQGAELFQSLTESGIPAVIEQRQGFFETREIQLMVSMLQVIDNPHQDIALAAVLLGPMFSLTEEELAIVRGKHPEKDLYDGVSLYENADDCHRKLRHFLDVLEKLRDKVTYATTTELIQDIYDATDIYESVHMMKDGVQRTANMDNLMEQARQFDSTTYRGLHQFVRYLEQIRQNKKEIGEVNLSGEEEDAVRIMTIHKSKGLEFPICFVAGMGKRIHDSRGQFLNIDANWGIAAPVVDNGRRTKKENLLQIYIRDCNKIKNIGECIRKLYVAMTRAEEKLILVGCIPKWESKGVGYGERRKINSMFDMVMPALHSPVFRLNVMEQEELTADCQKDLWKEAFQYERLYNFDTNITYNEMIQENLSWMEARESGQQESLPVKVSVSDLKVESMKEQEVEEFTVFDHEEEEAEKPVPVFMQTGKNEEKTKQGAAYGTIWHQVMATMDFTKTVSENTIEEELSRLVRTGRLRENERAVVNEKRLLRFFQSALGREMRKAAERGTLHREQPFVVGRRACDIFEDRQEEDTVLVQGIIDGYYETDEGIVLMDYKTDSLREGEESLLLERYRTQMELYRRALEVMTGKQVVRCVLYSFSLGKEIDY